MLSGRTPFALSLSSHVFTPLIVRGVYVFVNVIAALVAIVPLTVRSDPFVPVLSPQEGTYPVTPVSVMV